MPSSIGSQYQRTSDSIVNNGDNIFFETALVTDPDIDYNPSNAEFTLVQTGVYIISWWVSVQASASKYTSFSISSNTSTAGNTPNTKDQLSGSTILNVTTPNEIFSLRNTSGEPVKLGVDTPIKANISILKGALLTLENLVDGNSEGSVYGINSPPSYTMGVNAIAIGEDTTASGDNSFAQGLRTTASGSASHAEGEGSVASGDFGSHATGYYTVASGNTSHTEGFNSEASGEYSHAQGFRTVASGFRSHAEGFNSEASGEISHAQGSNTIADALNSTSAGESTTTDGVVGAFVVGRYGGPNNSINGTPSTKEYGFFVANGTSNTGSINKSLGAMILNNGQGYANAWNTSGADYGEMFESSNGLEIEPGYFVTFDNNDKIRIANSDDKLILGITSKTAGIIGNNNAFNWEGKYLKDEWGAYILDNDSNRIINPKYDETKEFKGKEERYEWVVVGLLGQILVRDDGSNIVGGYCSVGDGGIATYSDYGYPVLKRISDNQILIMFNSIGSFNHINYVYDKLCNQQLIHSMEIETINKKLQQQIDLTNSLIKRLDNIK